MLMRQPNWQAHKTDASIPQDSLSPGGQLRAAREAAGLSVTEVAEKLRLLEQVVQDIEVDDFSHSPGLIYTRGYLRAYARLVGVSTAPLLRAFDAMGWVEVEEPERPRVMLAREREQWMKMRWGWLSLCAVILLAVVVVVVWGLFGHH